MANYIAGSSGLRHHDLEVNAKKLIPKKSRIQFTSYLYQENRYSTNLVDLQSISES